MTNTDSQIDEWEKVHSEVPWGDVPEANFVRWCEARWWSKFPDTKAEFLEIGAGAGAQVKWLVEHGHNVTALECSASAIERMRGRAEAWVKIGDLQTKLVDIRGYENGTSAYDCVIDVCCLQHLTLDEATLVTQRARRWLKPAGWFFSKQVMKDHGLSRTSYMRSATLDGINQMFRGYIPVKIDICNEVVRGDVPLLHAIVTARVPI